MKLLNRITNLRKALKPLLVLCGVRRCCVCSKIARYKHMSIIGQIPFYVCKKHYKETSPAFGFDENVKDELNPSGRKMGLLDNNGNWVKLEYFNNA